MIRELLKAEAQTDAYAWAAVLLAHIAIGSALWTVFGIGGVMVYAAFELVQGQISRRMLWWDSALDWCGVALGANFASSLWNQDQPGALLTLVACAIVSLVGVMVRRGN